MRGKRLIAPAVVIAGSLYLWSVTLGFESLYTQSETFGPAFFPQLILGGLILVSLLQLARAFAAGVRTAAEGAAGETFHWRGFLAALAIAAAYVALMEMTGFLPATILFQVAVLAVVFGQRGRQRLAAVPAILTVLYFVIFIRILEMPLPRGWGWFREFSQLVYF